MVELIVEYNDSNISSIWCSSNLVSLTLKEKNIIMEHFNLLKSCKHQKHKSNHLAGFFFSCCFCLPLLVHRFKPLMADLCPSAGALLK